jgi:hypothetical protein
MLRRRLKSELTNQWKYILEGARKFPISVHKDIISWSLNRKGVFTTKSMYQHLERSLYDPNNKFIWKSKILLNIIFFLMEIDAKCTVE